MLKASASKHPLRGEDILHFLRSFEGGAATFAQNDERWSLWLPEVAAGDHPLTPASQVFFPVILRQGQQAIAIRFLYDCSTGKVRYYTSAIPGEIARLPEFENAVSELFRHSLPVEPMRERKLGKIAAGRLRKIEKPLNPRPEKVESLADPGEIVVSRPPITPAAPTGLFPPAMVQKSLPSPQESTDLVPTLSPSRPLVTPIQPVVVAPEAASNQPVEVHRSVRVEIGPRARSVFMVLILALAVVALAALGIYAYLQATMDPGIVHHELQIEEMRVREGR